MTKAPTRKPKPLSSMSEKEFDEKLTFARLFILIALFILIVGTVLYTINNRSLLVEQKKYIVTTPVYDNCYEATLNDERVLICKESR